MLGNPGHPHVEGEVDLGKRGKAGDWRRITIMRRCCQRHMAFAGQQARGGVKANPASAGQIDFRPGMQIGEIVVGASRAIQRYNIGLELDQIARDKARGQAEMAQDVDQQPARIPAGALAIAQRFLGRPDAGFEANDIVHHALQMGVQIGHEGDGVFRTLVEPIKELLQQRAGRLWLHIDRQIVAQILGILEWPGLAALLDEEVERIIDRHVGDQVDLDLEFGHRLGKHEARLEIAIGVLLHIDEVQARADPQGMAEHLGFGMRCRLQANDLRLQRDRAVIFVVGQMIDGGFDRHAASVARFKATDFGFPQRSLSGIATRG